VIVVESKQAGGAGILEVQAGSLRRICDLRHGRFNEPKALIKQTCTGQLVCTILS
jgi:expansin (peptidoglycan-binding protein)